MLTPPSDLQAERAVLGSVLIDAAQGIRALSTVSHILTAPEMFYHETNRKIWQAMLDLGEAVDSRTLASMLAERGQLDEIGGEPCLLDDLSQAVATAAHIEHYARIVARLYYERQIINEARRIAAEPEPTRIEPLRDLVLSREAMMSAAPSGAINEVLGDMVAHLDDPKAHKKIMTGYDCWDKPWGGMMPGEVNTWAAATNEGKSVLLLNLLLSAAGVGHKCLIFGTEMSAAELSQRMIAIHSGLSAWAIRRGLGPASNEHDRYLNACENLSKLPIVVIDKPEPSLADIEIAVSTHNADILFLDYLERFTMPPAENLRLSIREFMRRLKSLSRRRGVVTHLAAQLNRLSYPGDNGGKETRPSMSMLSESSSVEKESDRVMLIWSPKKANIDSKKKGYVEMSVRVSKNRHGSRGESTILSMSNHSLAITEMPEAELSLSGQAEHP